MIDASNTLTQVENSYWNLVAAWHNVAIQDDALKEAIEQQNSTCVWRGAAPPHGRYRRVADASRELPRQRLLRAANRFELQIQLKSLIVADPADPIWTANLVPSTSVQELPASGDLAQIIAEARQNRPEVRQAEDKRLQADLDRAFARNQSLPQANLSVQYLRTASPAS